MSDETMGPHAGKGSAEGARPEAEEVHARPHAEPRPFDRCGHRWVQLCDRAGPVVQGPIPFNFPPRDELEEYFAVFFCDRCLTTTRARIRGRRHDISTGTLKETW